MDDEISRALLRDINDKLGTINDNIALFIKLALFGFAVFFYYMFIV